MKTGQTRLIAVDWGTSALRGARLDHNGNVLEERMSAQGILSVAPGQFATVFQENFGDWLKNTGALTLISGMAGSKQGWVEAAYCPCPAGFDELTNQLTWVEPGRIAIVPGLHCEIAHLPDVMRGEEVQIFGAVHLTGQTEGSFVLPGTHSKWVQVVQGRVERFATYMTGEVFALLSQHSILARSIDPKAALDESTFLQGIERARRGQGLLHNAFSTRTVSLFERMAPPALASYLSGLVIGEELRDQSLQVGSKLVLIGSEALTARYALALTACGVQSQVLGSEATWAGLHALSKALAGPGQVTSG